MQMELLNRNIQYEPDAKTSNILLPSFLDISCICFQGIIQNIGFMALHHSPGNFVRDLIMFPYLMQTTLFSHDN
jgi:hypothetical protein